MLSVIDGGYKWNELYFVRELNQSRMAPPLIADVNVNKRLMLQTEQPWIRDNMRVEMQQ